MLFEIEADGQIVECAISREALQDVSGRRFAKPPELMECFAALQPRLEQVALDKWRSRSDAIEGLVTIWSDDLDDEPTTLDPAVPG